MLGTMKDINKICDIVKDELEIFAKSRVNDIDLVIDNIRIRIENDLTIPEGDKIKEDIDKKALREPS
jgi:hypothetical protein